MPFPPPRRYRNYGRRVIILRRSPWHRLLVLFAVLLAGVVLTAGGAMAGGWLEWAAGVGGALTLPVAWRADRQRVELRPDAVVVVNSWHTLVVPWADVERFHYEAGALVVRTDRRAHRISIFTPRGLVLPVAERRCRNAVRLMEECRQQFQRAAGEEVPVG
jgi:hypothetical protein